MMKTGTYARRLRHRALGAASLAVIATGMMAAPAWAQTASDQGAQSTPVAQATVPDLGITFGYVWAGLMFFSAALNIVLALTLEPATWAAVKSFWAIGSKLALFGIQYAVMKSTGVRRARAMMAAT